MASINVRVASVFHHVGSGRTDVVLDGNTPQPDPGVTVDPAMKLTFSFASGDPNTPDQSIVGEVVTLTI